MVVAVLSAVKIAFGVIGSPFSFAKKRGYKATDHHIDLVAAFQQLFLITGNEKWRERANHAKRFSLRCGMRLKENSGLALARMASGMKALRRWN